MPDTQMTRRTALATVAAALGLTALAGCAPAEWLDTSGGVTERDLEVARSIGLSEEDVEAMRESGQPRDDVRGAEAAEDYLAGRYDETFRATGVERLMGSVGQPERVSVALVAETGPAAGAACEAVYRLKDGPRWSDDYVSVRLDAQLAPLAAEAFSEGFGDLAEGEAVWGGGVDRTLLYADATDGLSVDSDASLADPGDRFAPKFVVFVPSTTSLTEEGLAERLGRSADVFRRAHATVFLHAYRVTTDAGEGGFTYEWADAATADGSNIDWACHLSTEAGGDS